MALKTPPGASSGHTTPVGALDTKAWFTPGRFAAFLGLMVLVGWPQVILGWETFYLGDYTTFGYPLAFYHRSAFWSGEVPLWNPYNNCGTPFLAQWNTLTCYPLSLIYLLLPLPWSLGLYCLAHLYLAGLGMYFLAWRWTGNRLAAAVAGTVFAFNGLTWFGLMWPNNIAAIGWMPWVVLVVERGWREGKWWVPAAAGVAAMQVLSGAPEVTFQTLLLVGALWILEVIRGDAPRFSVIRRSVLLGLLVLGITAVQMLPFLDLLVHSQRNTSYGDPSLMAMPLWGWANYLLPLFHTVKTPQEIYFQPGQTWTASYYVGIAAFALAMFGAIRVRRARSWLLLAMALFSLLMALGAPGKVYMWVSSVIPQMNFMRFPIKFVVLATFAMALLAGLGLAHWIGGTNTHRRLKWRWLGAISILSLIGVAGLILYSLAFPFPGEAVRATAVNGTVRVLLLGLSLGALALLGRETDLRLQRLWQSGIILLLWVDVYTHSSNLSPTVPSRVLAPGIIRDFFGWNQELHHGESRALQDRQSFWRMLADSSTDAEVDVHGRRLSQFFNVNLLDAVAKFDGFFSLEQREFSDIFRHIYFGAGESRPLKNFLGISHITHPTNSVDWLQRESFLPMLTGGQRVEFVDHPKALELILGENFEPLKTVYLPSKSRGVVASHNGGEVQIAEAQFSPHRISARVAASTPTIIVVSQAYYHCWRAYVDGQPVPLHRANHAFQAVEVPAGNRVLLLQYEDQAFRNGLVLSIISVLLCLTLASYHYWRHTQAAPRKK